MGFSWISSSLLSVSNHKVHNLLNVPMDKLVSKTKKKAIPFVINTVLEGNIEFE